MGKYILYTHAGSENHGCEALLRTSLITIPDIDAVYTGSISADQKYGLDDLIKLKPDKTRGFDSNFNHFIYKIKYYMKRDDAIYFKNLYRGFIRDIDKSKIYISIGGDNYCYHYSQWMEILNYEINRKGAKSVLWGCSINEDEFDNLSILEDLKRYSLITAREKLTYNLLKDKLPASNIVYAPDTAFLLPSVEKKLPEGFEEGNTIGINVSPVSIQNAKSGDKFVDYMVELINYIINNTNYQIAFIPHVVIPGNDDREVLNIIKNKCKNKDRIVLISDNNCMILKGYISRCEMFIGARTHATIAAYSTMVPTVSLGYSIKARGIAKDLFGSEKQFVLPVQSISSGQILIDEFCWLNEYKEKIRKQLIKIIPSYIKKISYGTHALEKL